MFLRSPDSALNLANFARTLLSTSLATLRVGMDVLQKVEGVRLDNLFAHGGLFATRGVAQKLLAAAVNTAVSVGDSAAEGGAWGIAVLAAFRTKGRPDQPLADFLNEEVFAGADLDTVHPDPVDVEGFEDFVQRFIRALPVERAAVAHT